MRLSAEESVIVKLPSKDHRDEFISLLPPNIAHSDVRKLQPEVCINLPSWTESLDVEVLIDSLKLKNGLVGEVKILSRKTDKLYARLPGDDYRKIKNGAYLGGSRVRVFTAMRPRKCFKCQAFGHIAPQCKAEARCGGCGSLEHLEAECKTDPLDRPCIHCKKKGHSSNDWKRCTVLSELQLRLLERTDL